MWAKRKGGMIIRLVDIVLIILFGFILISEVNRQTDIELPSSRGENPEAKVEERYFHVNVYRNGDVWPNSDLLMVQLVLPSEAMPDVRAERYDQLVENLKRGNRHALPVAIHSERRSPVQYTVDVIDACKKLGYKKFIRCFDETQPGAAN